MDSTPMLLYGLFAAGVAVLATVAIERFGGRIGGLLATVPTTIIPASLGIWSESAEHADFVWAMAVVPMGMWVNSFFLWLWRVIPPRLSSERLGPRLASMLLVGLTGWALAASSGLYLCKKLRLFGVEPLLLGGVVTCLMTGMGIAACWHHVPSPSGSQRVSFPALASRGVLAGLCIVFSVWLTAVGMPLVSGIASVFPAIFLTTMVSVWLAQGEAVQSGAVGPMMLGSTSVSVFALIAASVLHLIPVWLGLVASWIGSILLVSIPAYLWLQRRQMTPHTGA